MDGEGPKVEGKGGRVVVFGGEGILKIRRSVSSTCRE